MPAHRSLGRLIDTLNVLVASACGDRLVEWFARDVARGSYVDRGHQAVVPLAILGCALLVVAIAWARAERANDGASLARAARAERATSAFGRVGRIVATAAVAATVSLGMEAVERQLGGGAAFGGMPLAGTNALAFAWIFLACASATSGAAAAVVRCALDAIDAVARTIVRVALCIARRDALARTCERRPSRRRVSLSTGTIVARSHGDRAPPFPSFATR